MSSPASTSSYSTSVAGDDRSSISSSSSSQSDASYGSHFPLWTPEPGPLSPPTPCSCLPSCSSSSRTSGCSSGAPRWQREEYQAPSLLRLQYDSPRNLLHTLAFKDPPPQGGASELGRDRRLGGDGDQGQIQGHECPSLPSTPTVASLQWVETPRQAPVERLLSWSSERAPPVDSGDRCSIMSARLTPRPLLLPGCPVCGGTQVIQLWTPNSY
uniref:Uncharacterized protein n=1 Tax=Oncorhynchus mykiss TaxID=8022 RepID=A0A8K9VFY2_ONCMY